ncbi:MAG: FadR/GntR family transcriptional regulator [Bacillota bacterium]
MQLKPVKKEKISDQIIEQIFKLIVNGNFKPGDKMPSERKLSELFNVSRNSVREAIHILEMLGFLISRRGDGNYIADMSSKVFSNYVNKNTVDLKEINISDAVEARLLIEPSIAALAAERITVKQLNMLKNILDDIKINTEKENRSANLYFHHMLAKASQNKVLEATSKFLFDYSRNVSQKSAEISNNVFPNRKMRKYEEHKKILEAVENRDIAQAKKMMYKHLENVKLKLESARTD